MGMNIHFLGNGTAYISMKHYIKQVLQTWADIKVERKHKASIPATKGLFEVDDGNEPAPENTPQNNKTTADIFGDWHDDGIYYWNSRIGVGKIMNVLTKA